MAWLTGETSERVGTVKCVIFKIFDVEKID